MLEYWSNGVLRELPKSSLQYSNIPSLRTQNNDGAAGRRHAAPGLRHANLGFFKLARAGFAAKLEDNLGEAVKAARFEHVADP